MFSTKSLFAAAATLSFVAPSTAQVNSVYNPGGKTNLVMYWGQGANQADLINYCNIPEVDIIVIGFVNTFPPAANGYVEQNFGNKCWAGSVYSGPGYNGKKVPANDLLLTQCPTVQQQIPQCLAKKKKILLSIGGAVNTWNPKTGKMDKTYVNQLKTAADGTYFANFLWKAYGPKDPTYTGVRPLDRGLNNATASISIEVDGFDFDIEGTAAGTNPNNGETAAYIAMIKRLRVLMNAQTAKTGKKYLLSAAPQCTLKSGKESNMDAMMYYGGFDIIFIQFYNQGPKSCTARSRAAKTGTFNWDAWHTYITNTNSASKLAKMYIGLLAGPAGSTQSGDYINVAETQNLIAAFGKKDRFAGVMLWDGRAGSVNNAADLKGKRYWNIVKAALYKNYPPKTKRDHISHMKRHQHKH